MTFIVYIESVKFDISPMLI